MPSVRRVYPSLVALAVAVTPPGALLAADPVSPTEGDVLVERTVLREGLVYSRYRHSKRNRDYGRLSSLLRNYATEIEIGVVSIDPSRYAIRVLDATDYAPGRATVRQIALASGAIGAVNGGFFDEKEEPLGLVVTAGKERSPFRWRDRPTAGVFYEREGRYNIIANGTYRRYFVHTRPPTPMGEAVQCFPLLVARGEPRFPWREGAKVAARTAVGIGQAGQVVFAVTENTLLDGIPLAELATFMAGTLRCRLALNLDGGPSSQLYVRAGPREYVVEGRDRIRTALAIFPGAEDPAPPD